MGDCEFEVPMDDYPPIRRDRPRRPRRVGADGQPAIRAYAPQYFGCMHLPIMVIALVIAIPMVIAVRVRRGWDWLVGY